MALSHVMNTVYAAADNKKATVLVGLDISAAFDTINHDILIGHLKSQFGLGGGVSSWLCSCSYLTDRQQFGDHSSATTHDVRCTGCDLRCLAASAEQLGQSSLPAQWPN